MTQENNAPEHIKDLTNLHSEVVKIARESYIAVVGSGNKSAPVESVEEKANEIYSRMTSYANYSEMNGIEKGWFIKKIATGFEEYAAQLHLKEIENPNDVNYIVNVKGVEVFLEKLYHKDLAKYMSEQNPADANIDNLKFECKNVLSYLESFRSEWKEGEGMLWYMLTNALKQATYPKSVAGGWIADIEDNEAIRLWIKQQYNSDTIEDSYNINEVIHLIKDFASQSTPSQPKSASPIKQ